MSYDGMLVEEKRRWAMERALQALRAPDDWETLLAWAQRILDWMTAGEGSEKVRHEKDGLLEEIGRLNEDRALLTRERDEGLAEIERLIGENVALNARVERLMAMLYSDDVSSNMVLISRVEVERSKATIEEQRASLHEAWEDRDAARAEAATARGERDRLRGIIQTLVGARGLGVLDREGIWDEAMEVAG